MSIINDALQKAGEGKRIISGPPSVRASQETGFKQPAETQKNIFQHKWPYAVCAAIILVSIILLFGKKDISRKSAEIPKTIVVSEAQTAREIIPENFVDTPLVTTQNYLPDQTDFKLTGIVLGKGSPMAIINDSVYMTGDTIMDLRVVEITKNTVSLEKDGIIFELRIK